jgi:hypothetical protein
VVLVSRLRAALERLNPALPPEAITAAVDELTRDRSASVAALQRSDHPPATNFGPLLRFPSRLVAAPKSI